MKRAYERLLVKSSCKEKPQHFRDASTMGWPPGRAAAVEWSQPDPGGLQRGELEIWLKTFGGAKRSCDVWIPDIGTRDIILKLPWIPQDVRDARTVVYLLRKAANRVEPAQEKQVCCSQQSRKELEIWRALWHQIWSLEFPQLVFGLAFPHYVILDDIIWCCRYVIYFLTLIL